MSNYGFMSDNLGGINDGHKALNLWSHGRGVPIEYPINAAGIRPMSETRWIFEFPPVPDGEMVVMFVGVENKSNSAVMPMNISNGKASALRKGNYEAPYFYIYSTAIPQDQINDSDYGMEVYDSNGNKIYNSSRKTLKPIGTYAFYEEDFPIQGKDIAILPILRSIHFDPGMNTFMGITTNFIGRTDNRLNILWNRETISVPNSQALASQLNAAYGELEKYPPTVTIIDVSDIEKVG